MSGHEWPLVTGIWRPKGFFYSSRGDSGQEKKLRSPERALCSPGMPEARRPTVYHNQYPHKPKNMWGRADGWMAGWLGWWWWWWRGSSGPCSLTVQMMWSWKCFYFFCGCGQVKVGEVTFLSFSQSALCYDFERSCARAFCVFNCLIYFCVCF